MKFPIKDFFRKFDQIRKKLQIWSHLLKKSLMENFIFCVVSGLVIWKEWKRMLGLVNIETSRLMDVFQECHLRKREMM